MKWEIKALIILAKLRNYQNKWARLSDNSNSVYSSPYALQTIPCFKNPRPKDLTLSQKRPGF